MKGAIAVVLIAAGLLLFISTVDRSPWVLAAPVLVGLGAWLLVEAIEVRTVTITDAVEVLAAEHRTARR